MRKLLVLYLTLCAVAPAFAFMTDGNDLVDAWRAVQRALNTETADTIDYAGASYFIGYVTAVFDGLAENPTFAWGDVSIGQLTMVVGKWLDAHLERWSEPGVILIYAALLEAFGAG